MYAVRIHEYGGREVLSYEKMGTPEPAGGELLIKTCLLYTSDAADE